MSWHLTAGGIVHRLMRWKELSKDARYLMKLVLWFHWEMRDNYAEMSGACRAVDQLRKKCSQEGETVEFCWGCGTLVACKKSYSKEYPDFDVPEGWLLNTKHQYSALLCPRCQESLSVVDLFLQKVTSGTADIAEYGVGVLPEFRNLEPGWRNDEEPGKGVTDRAIERIAGWIDPFIERGPYGALPEELDG